MAFCGRADLVRMLGKGLDKRFLADLAGYEITDQPPEPVVPHILPEQLLPDIHSPTDTFQPQTSEIKWADLPFFYAQRFESHEKESKLLRPVKEVKTLTKTQMRQSGSLSRAAQKPTPPLASWPRLRKRVSKLLEEQYHSTHLDVKKLLHDMSRGKLPKELPMQFRSRWPQKLNVFIDRSRRLIPFEQDQDQLLAKLYRHFGYQNVYEFLYEEDNPHPILLFEAFNKRWNIYQNPSVPVLILGDCGSLTGYTPMIDHWLHVAKRLNAQGIRCSVLFPGPTGRWMQKLDSRFKMAAWDISGTLVKRHSDSELSQRADDLLCLVSHTSRVEPGLLRTIRRLLPAGKADAGTESDVWTHPYISSSCSLAATIHPEKLDKLQEKFHEKTDLELRNKIEKAIKEWHETLPKEIWYEEFLNLPEEDQKQFPEEERKAAEAYFIKVAQTMLTPGDTITPKFMDGMQAWFKRSRKRTFHNKKLWEDTPELSQRLQKVDAMVHREASVIVTVPGYDPRLDGDPEHERRWAVHQQGSRFVVSEVDDLGSSPTNGSAIAILRATRPKLHCVPGRDAELEIEGYPVDMFLDPTTGKVTRQHLPIPKWATAMGQDQYSIWATFTYKNVEQRLRWMAPGRFTMGSSKSEVGRDDDETQHKVTLTRGYWLFDTPVTQALWKAVMGDNPSRFKGDTRPVEQVSWEDANRFIQKLNGEKPGLDLQLPSEAQWEYACRADMTTATYAGDLTDESRDSILNDIAWYTGNSSNQTHPVAQKKANPWGLYDMLGNVDEWCHDWWQKDLGTEPVVDPQGPAQGTYRVFRGGGWIFSARYVRAACRSGDDPGYRNDILGFRCARVQVRHEQGGSGSGGAGQATESAERGNTVPAKPAKIFLSANGTKYHIQAKQRIELPATGALQLQTDQGKLTIATLSKPDWARAIGRDRYGLWLDFAFDTVTQRMRYIPPGQFVMGSPASEAGRYDREKQHLVTLTQGYWLFDTPVTQALWKKVMGKNPSRFQTPDRPVEQVSWEDCKTFIEKLNREKPGLILQLPSEAQWEYACRAGTTTATYAGEMKIIGESNAPILDNISWYGGNSGVDFELKNGYDSSGWKEKQYDHKKAGSHPVGKKLPNPWGLHDMLGNVYEWCEDWYEEYPGGDAVDPQGPDRGAYRVFRGGSWIYVARDVRAASRDHDVPGYRNSFLGFRCARVQDA